MRVIDLGNGQEVEDAPVVLTARTWVMMAGYMTIMARIVTG